MQFATNNIQIGAAVFTGAGAGDGATESLGHGLESVADSEYRNPKIEHTRV